MASHQAQSENTSLSFGVVSGFLIQLSYACNKWLLALHNNKKIGIYCSDIAGAFDRVATHVLLKKLYRKGIRTEMLNFLNSYLSPRKATVCVGGKLSELKELLDTVFQGTILGPALWNTFFDDISRVVASADLVELLFADDLNCFKTFSNDTSNEEILTHLKKGKKLCHD